MKTNTKVLLAIVLLIAGGIAFIIYKNSNSIFQQAQETVTPTDLPQQETADQVSTENDVVSSGESADVNPLTKNIAQKEEIPAPVSSEYLPLLTFRLPLPGVELSAKEGTKIEWQLVDSTIQQVYPAADTYIVLHLVDESGETIGSIGDGYKLSEPAATWDIASNLDQDFFTLVEGMEYKIRAELSRQPREYTCDPAFPKDCLPIYSAADQALIDKAKRYQSESGWFTISMDGYEHPAADIDDASLTFNKNNTELRGTSNLDRLQLKIEKDSKYFIDTPVPVVDGTWVYEPEELPKGTYTVSLWNRGTYISGEILTVLSNP